LNRKRILESIAGSFLAAGIVLIASRALFFHQEICSFPQQLEPTEGGLMMSTRAILAGWDPWAVTLAPVYSNNYGIGYPWVVALVSHLTPGLGLLEVMRAVTALSIFFVLGLVYLTLRDAACGPLEAAAASLVVYLALLFGDIPSGRPDGLALALYMASLALVFRPGFKAVALAAVLAALAYFVKPYAILALGLGGFHLARSHRWRDLQKFLALGLGTAVITALWVSLHHPYYFLGTLFILSNNVDYRVIRLLDQLRDLLFCHFPLLLVVLGGAWVAFKDQRSWRPEGSARDWGWLAFGCLAVLAAGPGGHMGAYMRYFNELFVPLALLFLVLWARQLRVWSWLLVLALIGNAALCFNFNRQFSYPVSAEDYAGWDKADLWIKNHPRGVFPPLFTCLAAAHHAYIVDTDHSHYLPSARAFGLPSPIADFAIQRRNWYLGQMRLGQLQTIVCGDYWPCPLSLTAMGYREADTICLRTPMTVVPVCFYAYVPVKAVAPTK
jgi:hypothetical protein